MWRTPRESLGSRDAWSLITAATTTQRSSDFTLKRRYQRIRKNQFCSQQQWSLLTILLSYNSQSSLQCLHTIFHLSQKSNCRWLKRLGFLMKPQTEFHALGGWDSFPPQKVTASFDKPNVESMGRKLQVFEKLT